MPLVHASQEEQSILDIHIPDEACIFPLTKEQMHPSIANERKDPKRTKRCSAEKD